MKHIAVIGAGSIGRRHIGNLRLLHPGARIYWLGATGVIAAAERDADIVYPANLDELLRIQPDYCIVASPASSHLQFMSALLAKHVPVLVEKPLAATLAEGKQMQQLSLANPTTPVAVAYCLRFLPALQLLKSTLQNGNLGKVLHINCHVAQYLPDWRPGKDYRHSVSARASLGGGVLLELSHELDYLHYLFGSLQLHYSQLQQSGLLDIDVEDQADLFMSTQSGASVSLHQDFLQKTVQRRCMISTTEARLEWDLVQNSIWLFTGSEQQLLFSEPEYQRNQMYLQMLSAFEQQLRQPGTTNTVLATVDDALCTLSLIEQAKQQQASFGR
ncbi:Gfo/Idh/MocA family protein [Rheinheimera sp. 4Y26]|uniref:Gfo/Idh/MocA family protein n=1 Tax=Rheinheimera sp. 4Y26 TaxID=2977811 RepID=UPI0021B0DA7F|nr:Gfo/Idh/MocA family oxidoreductase [Rheinheimera sp. 4Y26]MCT6700568.1 Gfo/Idh/MocA family oxidoreductase [Rheinheimera sp. 4Y26]